jgi:hypothetical protein
MLGNFIAYPLVGFRLWTRMKAVPIVSFKPHSSSWNTSEAMFMSSFSRSKAGKVEVNNRCG